MKCSIMLITYNRSKELLRAVQSCVPWMTNDMELVIVDNNSPDDSQMVVESYLKTAKVQYTYHKSDENLGVAGGRNLAYALCQGEIVFSLDDDAVIVTPDFFTILIEFMDRHPRVACAEVTILEPETDSTLNSIFKARLKGQDHEIIRSFCGCAHVLRRSFYHEGPLYPAKLFFGSEELYPSLQAWGAGQEVALIEPLVVHHRPSVINRFSGKTRNFNIFVNTYIVKKLTYPIVLRPFIWLNLTIRLIKHGTYDASWRKKLKETLNERYDPQERSPISLGMVLTLVHRFGLFAIL